MYMSLAAPFLYIPNLPLSPLFLPSLSLFLRVTPLTLFLLIPYLLPAPLALLLLHNFAHSHIFYNFDNSHDTPSLRNSNLISLHLIYHIFATILNSNANAFLHPYASLYLLRTLIFALSSVSPLIDVMLLLVIPHIVRMLKTDAYHSNGIFLLYRSFFFFFFLLLVPSLSLIHI